MCARDGAGNTPSLMDEQTIARAEEGLTRLTESGQITEGMVREAESALRLLRDRVKNAHARRQNLRAQSVELERQALRSETHHRQVDRAIIDARIRAGDMLMARDSLARDVVRARRALDAVHDNNNSDNDNNDDDDDVDDINSRFISWQRLASIDKSIRHDDHGQEDHADDCDDHELNMLRRGLADEMASLRAAEKQLVDVVDEITRIRRKRSELRRKLRDAEQEW